MKFPAIPRGVVIFLGGIVILLVVILGFRFLLGTGSSTTGGSVSNSLFSALFPFGNTAPAQSVGQASLSASSTPSGPVPVLRQVSPEPVAGAWFSANPASTSTPLIRFMDRASGNVTATPADSYAEVRISNTTFPGVEELYATAGSFIILRTFSGGQVQNLYALMSATSSEQSLNASPLRPFDRLSVADGSLLTVREVSGGSRTELSKADGSKSQILFASPVASWVPLFGGGRAFLETAPAASALGYLYEIKNAALSKISGGLPGFMAIVSPSGRYIAESWNGGNGFQLAIIDTNTGAVTTEAVGTLATKCAWIPNREPLLFCAVPKNPAAGTYPDDWLMGKMSFSDDAWVLNPSTKTGYFIGTLADRGGAALDAENVSIDPTGSYAIFMNRRDLSLWSLRIAETVNRAAKAR